MIHRSGSQIREDFLRFFEGKGHRRVHSSSLVPANDPTLLFTNAGMNQFKDVFLGTERREYSRAVSSQKCVRAGGKHNDLENVGFTRRHHTFFEMLGNFSFGDYFKREAIAYAWELLTSPEWFGIDPAKLYVTIFEGDAKVPRDEEAFGYWREVGVPAERIVAMGAKDNFWQMGDTGPCGPCSEIYYDLGVAASKHTKSEQDQFPGAVDLPFPHDEDRYVEIWNLVFMQFDRVCARTESRKRLDGTFELYCAEYRLDPLPKPSIDTGMGLERVAAVLQGVLSNFETDLFVPLILAAARLTGTGGKATEVECVTSADDPVPPPLTEAELRAGEAKSEAELVGNASLRIIADHARAATFLIADGVLPANEGRGYVLRKILRRGIRHGRLLGQEKPFMHQMVFAVRDEMGVAYPELKSVAERVSQVVLAEEEQFARVMLAGATQLDRAIYQSIANAIEPVIEAFCLSHAIQISRAKDPDMARFLYPNKSLPERKRAAEYFIGEANSEALEGQLLIELAQSFERGKPVLTGADAFRVFETYGLPKDFIVEACRDAEVSFDDPGFERAKEEEQQRARASWKGGSQKTAAPVFRELAKTEFEGYTALRVDGARVLALVKEGVGVPALAAGEAGEAVLDATSFYADSGGQVGDVGVLLAADHQTVMADVSGATRPVQGVFSHRIVARQALAVGDTVDTVVDGENRRATERNHTGTHLLHAALREVLGTHVKQAGSLVDATRLRFDFSHFTGVADEELAEIESIVNREVLANEAVETLVDVPIDTAIGELGATALFGEKYGERVRVVQIGGLRGFSTELCGGTHTRATGEIGLVKLVGEQSVSSGVRRIEAVSGTGSLREFRRGFELARTVGQLTGAADGESLRSRLASSDEELKRLRRELDQLRMKAAAASVEDAAAGAVEVQGIKVLAQRVDGLGSLQEAKNQMRTLADTLRGKLGSGVVVLGAVAEGKVALVAAVTKDLTGRVQAGKLVGALAAKVGGKGGGRADLAEAGGSDAGALDGALTQVAEVVRGLLG